MKEIEVKLKYREEAFGRREEKRQVKFLSLKPPRCNEAA